MRNAAKTLNRELMLEAVKTDPPTANHCERWSLVFESEAQATRAASALGAMSWKSEVHLDNGHCSHTILATLSACGLEWPTEMYQRFDIIYDTYEELKARYDEYVSESDDPATAESFNDFHDELDGYWESVNEDAESLIERFCYGGDEVLFVSARNVGWRKLRGWKVIRVPTGARLLETLAMGTDFTLYAYVDGNTIAASCSHHDGCNGYTIYRYADCLKELLDDDLCLRELFRAARHVDREKHDSDDAALRSFAYDMTSEGDVEPSVENFTEYLLEVVAGAYRQMYDWRTSTRELDKAFSEADSYDTVGDIQVAICRRDGVAIARKGEARWLGLAAWRQEGTLDSEVQICVEEGELVNSNRVFWLELEERWLV